ncbi:expressed protein, partial [Phakopsora pachyrhizi]
MSYWEAADCLSLVKLHLLAGNICSSRNTAPTTPITRSLSYYLFNYSDDCHNLVSYYQRQNLNSLFFTTIFFSLLLLLLFIYLFIYFFLIFILFFYFFLFFFYLFIT